MKCLPSSKLPMANGTGLHDWHAETLALRAFNHFVLDECKNMILTGRPSQFLRLCADEKSDGSTRRHAQPFAWLSDVSLHMYCSETPCRTVLGAGSLLQSADRSRW